MDEGIAGLITGFTGMGGAIAGAIAGGVLAVRGARIGGSKAVEAARLQVEGQAAAGHLQWVRDQRQQAYTRLLDAYSAVDDTLMQAAPRIRAGGDFSADARVELRTRLLAIQTCTGQLVLWGPDEVVHLAQVLTLKAMEAAQALQNAQTGLPLLPGQPNSQWHQWEEANRQMTLAHSRFVDRAGQIVRDPRQSTP